ncbi:MAG TPA: oligosaccharide flippase family protein [Terriglobales bacterium]|nr:oligosaccharide flippase family protein [Terriglobales bacterium]
MASANAVRLTVQLTSSIRRYGGYAFSVAGARVIGILISSATLPYLVRQLGVEIYGLWSYVVSICAFLNVVAEPGINTFTMQQIAARREAAFELIPNATVLRLLSSLAALVMLVAVAHLETRVEMRRLLYLYGIGMLFVNLASADYLLTALEMFHTRSLLTVLQQVMYALSVFACVRSSKDLLWLPISILGSSVLSGIIAWAVLIKMGVRIPLRIDTKSWKGIAIPSFHYAASTLMSNTYHRLGHIAVRLFLGDFALGIYAVAVRVVEILRGFLNIIGQVMMPRLALAAESTTEIRRLSTFAVSFLALISVPVTVGVMATSQLVVPWLFGAKYRADAELLRWIAPYLITAPAASLFAGTILFSLGRHRAYLSSTLAGALASVVLFFALTPSLGIKGAALAFVLSEAVVATTAALSLPEIYESWKNPALTISLRSALLMLIAVKLANTYTTQAVLIIAIGAAVYFASCGRFFRKLLIEF